VSAEILKLDASRPQAQHIHYAASWLMRGDVVAIPTDTLYALAADPVNLAAVERVFQVKGRPEPRALPILINCMDQALTLGKDLPAAFYKLAEVCWPGPLTIVVDASKNEVVRRLIEETGGPLAGTSANISGRPTCSSGEEVFRQLGDRVPIILDSGATRQALPSTIVELRGEQWCIGREGALPSSEIYDALDGMEGDLA
jgi:L-threonylcarbamoyladenylate synthase